MSIFGHFDRSDLQFTTDGDGFVSVQLISSCFCYEISVKTAMRSLFLHLDNIFFHCLGNVIFALQTFNFPFCCQLF